MSFLTDISEGMASIIVEQFDDLCDLELPVWVNADGQLTEPAYPNAIATSIKCAFEPWRSHTDHVFQLRDSGLASGSVTHKILLPITAATMSITFEYRIRIHARGVRPEIVFEQALRLDESLSPLIILGATMRNQ